MEGSAAHGSILGRVPVSEDRLRESPEIEITKDRRRIVLLHNAAAGATRILPLNFAVSFNENRATARCIEAMPAFSGFHDHGPFSSLRKNGWMSAKAIAGWARDERGANICISKQKSKCYFIAYRKYITSTGGNGDAVQRRSGGTSPARVTGQVAELACSTWIDNALMEQPKTYQCGPKRGGVCK
jgi:hypothetical protein